MANKTGPRCSQWWSVSRLLHRQSSYPWMPGGGLDCRRKASHNRTGEQCSWVHMVPDNIYPCNDILSGWYDTNQPLEYTLSKWRSPVADIVELFTISNTWNGRKTSEETLCIIVTHQLLYPGYISPLLLWFLKPVKMRKIYIFWWLFSWLNDGRTIQCEPHHQICIGHLHPRARSVTE